jgi:hypothetical protein
VVERATLAEAQGSLQGRAAVGVSVRQAVHDRAGPAAAPAGQGPLTHLQVRSALKVCNALASWSIDQQDTEGQRPSPAALGVGPAH